MNTEVKEVVVHSGVVEGVVLKDGQEINSEYVI